MMIQNIFLQRIRTFFVAKFDHALKDLFKYKKNYQTNLLRFLTVKEFGKFC